MKRLLFLLTLLSWGSSKLLFAQPSNIDLSKSTSIKKTNESVILDGILNESDWENAEIASGFSMTFPVDDKLASKKTEVKLMYDDQYIYVAATCFDDDKYIIQTLKRDDFGDSDEFGVLFDPVGEKTTGFGFGVNAMGALTETLIASSDDGNNNLADDSWNNKWDAKVSRQSDRWIVEIAIPFKTLRFKEDLSQWKINFIRIEPGLNEKYAWSPVPRQFSILDMTYYGSLNWETAPVKKGSNISLIPYATTRADDNVNEKATLGFSVGGDAKIAITPTLNIDLTFNPDFSQVEVDQQVTNLTRFNIFFPERRQFFLENADIFSAYGQGQDRPFFSRRIGLDANGNTVPIIYGARISGNLTQKLRVGGLNMQTQGDSITAGQNYSALSFQYRLGKRTAVKGFFLNRQGFEKRDKIENDFGRNAGVELATSSTNGKWQGNIGYLNSMKSGFNSKNNYLHGVLRYNGTNFRSFLSLKNIQENFFSDMGFNGRLNNFNPETNEVVRVGFSQISNSFDYYIYPKESKKVNFHWSGLENYGWFNPNGSINEWYTRLRHFIFFKNTSELRFRLNNNYVDLLFPFAITTPFIPVDSYNMNEFNIQFNTDRRKYLQTEMFIVYGQFYNGNKLTYRGSVSYRAQPWGNFTLGLERNDIWFPAEYQDVSFTLASARAEINFSTNLFWTTFLQYNTQRDNFNINSRLQWRYAPMSDLFIVYTDNYAVENMFGPKSRSIVLKLNYWLTL